MLIEITTYGDEQAQEVAAAINNNTHYEASVVFRSSAEYGAQYTVRILDREDAKLAY